MVAGAAGQLLAAGVPRAPERGGSRRDSAEDGQRQHRHQRGDHRRAGQGRVQQHDGHLLPTGRTQAARSATAPGRTQSTTTATTAATTAVASVCSIIWG